LIAATLVYAEIFATFNQNDPNYFEPPDTAIEIPVDDGEWRSEHIPGARHSSTEPYPSNVLVIWALFAGTGIQTVRTVRSFVGRTADVVSCCEGSGTGSGSGGGPRSLRATAKNPSVALDLAPLLWILWVAGFEAGRQIFNGSWSLQLRTGGIGGHCVWDNGGDGIARPRIQLRCESPLAVEWRLHFEANGGDPIVYARSALDWNPVGSNSLVLARNGSRGVIPEAMTVIPG
jgi:hypothetical protein